MLYRLIWLLAIVFCSLQCSAPKTPPNILLILTDDQGYGDLGFHGNTAIHTPQLDQFFHQGSTIPQFYVNPVCAPTRASILTGRYYQRAGVHGVTRGRERMRIEEQTMADLFREAGYQTAVFGKWHNGANYPYHPLARGFDHFTGFSSGHYSSYFDTTIEKDGEAFLAEGYLPDVITQEALDFMAKNKAQNKPFFCFVTFQTPHTPLHVPDRYFDPYIAQGLDAFTAAIYGMCENIDDNLGRMMALLDTLQLKENTIVIFLTDNGPLTLRYNDGLKGRKGTVDEGGVRVPFGIQWPGTIPGGQSIEGAWAHIDLLPTLLDLTRVHVNPKNTLDGTSFAPRLMQKSQVLDRTLFDNWGGRVRLQRDSLLLTQNGLYDLKNDRGQTHNLEDQLPKLKAQLQSEFHAWEATLPEKPKILPFQLGLPSQPKVVLEASQALLQPPFEFRKDRRHTGIAYHSLHGWAHDWIDFWTDTQAYAVWNVESLETTTYEVYLEYGLDTENKNVKLVLSAKDQQLNIAQLPVFEPLALPDYDRVPRTQEAPAMQWKLHKVGELKFPKGNYPLSLQTTVMGGTQSIELKSIRLHPKK
jgi:arylsulfatase A-like enzyme